MAELRAAVHSPGALDRTIAAPFGDIATATGQPYNPPAGIVAEVDGFTRQTTSEDMRDGDTFAAAVEPPVGASPLVQLVAFTGRRV